MTMTTLEGPSAKPAKAPLFHIPSLDGIRAVSFLIVFLSHAGLKGKVPGYFGLSVFFFLSGYLITTLLRIEFDKKEDISLKQFYWRRAFRILPPFYLVLLLAYLLTGLGAWTEGSMNLAGVASQMLHVTNYYIVERGWWDGIAPGTWVYWSLAVEEHFYLVFPLLYLWMRKRGMSGGEQALMLLSLCAIVLSWRCILVYVLEATKDRTYVASDTRIDSIVAGCILAVWKNPVLDVAQLPSSRRLGLVWLPLGVTMLLVSLVIREPNFEQSFRYSLQSFGLLPVFMAAICWHDRFPFTWLNTRLAAYLGLLSYAMYLLHTMVIWGFEDRTSLPEPLVAVLSLAVVIAGAALMHRFVEKPFAKLRRRFSDT